MMYDQITCQALRDMTLQAATPLWRINRPDGVVDYPMPFQVKSMASARNGYMMSVRNVDGMIVGWWFMLRDEDRVRNTLRRRQNAPISPSTFTGPTAHSVVPLRE